MSATSETTTRALSSETSVLGTERPRVHGKFLFVGDTKLYVRGVTYGTFRPTEDGVAYDPEVTERDFAQMAANGVNAIRTYTAPPRWLLDAAQRHGLYVMVGLAWEQHIAFLEDSRLAPIIEDRVRASVASCAGHPAVLCYAIGNEIPAAIVRWHGHRRVEHFLERLWRSAKTEDPNGLVTYVNYPTTEYLELPFLDIVSFNVFLESQERFEAYLARLHNVGGERPLIMTELGLDSLRHGQEAQARSLEGQVSSAFASGCAGAFVFSWTDEWHRSGFDIEDWEFGLTDRERRPKPALAAVSKVFAEAPFRLDTTWPKCSVVVCSYNGARTIRDCLEALRGLEYPDFEVILVDDGSTDETVAIAAEYDCRVVSTENHGLSSARNTGLEAASGEIIAYIDDDAYPDPHWLTYIAATFENSTHVGVGGPNLPPLGDGLVAECVAKAPGGPNHVLLSDRQAEHVPGCNMAFRKEALRAIGGFDAQFRSAGDDVDVCWRLQERGWTLGFHPAAVVWHHRRNSVRAYWRQQRGYGKAEALLEKKWPEKYNSAGHLSWSGRIYGSGITKAIGWWRPRIYQGTWGGAPFQSLYQPVAGTLSSLPLMPEWYLAIVALAALSALGALWPYLLLALPFLVLMVAAPVLQAILSAADSPFQDTGRSRFERLRLRSLTACLHLLQPLARLSGRLVTGLTPWRSRGTGNIAWPWPRRVAIWSEEWRSAATWLVAVERAARQDGGATVRRGGDFDRWDLEAQGGLFAKAHLRMAIEEHGAGRQLVRFRAWPTCTIGAALLVALIVGLAVAAIVDGALAVGLLLTAVVGLVVTRVAYEEATALAALLRSLKRITENGAG